jgi:hypothetical protein
MSELYIRLDNKFVIRKGKKYFITTVNKVKEWNKMSVQEKNKCIDKDVTSKVKRFLKKYGSKSNINFKTRKSKKRIRTKRRVMGG